MELTPPHVLGARLEQFKDPCALLGKKGLRLGGYVRVSTAKEEQRSSIENQKRILEEWAQVNGHVIVRHYVDVRTGAYSRTRSEIEELLRDVRLGKLDGVVTKEISRTSRDVLDLLELKRQLASYGACLLSIKEGYDSRVDEDEFFLILHGGFAQRERRAIAARVKLSQLLKAKQGLANVSSPAFGYKRGADGKLEPDPVLAPVYREMVQRYLSGWGQARIAQWLNSQGIAPKRGRKWYPSSVRAILCNPVYLGVTIYNATALIRDETTGMPKRVIRPRQEWVIRQGTHQPLIQEAEWEELQRALKLRARPHWRYLGSGILRCGGCGQKLEGNGSRGRYYCTNKQCASPVRSWDMVTCDRLLLELLQGETCKEDQNRHVMVHSAQDAPLKARAYIRETFGQLEQRDLVVQRTLLAKTFEAVYVDQQYRLHGVIKGKAEVARGLGQDP
ncbi:MAG: recombinase family protein [Bacillota bacterium]